MEPVDITSSDESNSSGVDMEVNYCTSSSFESKATFNKPYCSEISPDDALLKKAQIYQDYMKQIPIPAERDSIVRFTTWVKLGKSLKRLYGQPLHYLTNIQLKQWDLMRSAAKDENERLDIVMHPCKAEVTIWLLEEIHRRTSSHLHLANLWKSDPMYHSCIDSTFPTL